MTDFEKIFNVFKEVGIKMIVTQDKSKIILAQGASETLAKIYYENSEFIDGTKDADGYYDFYCEFYFDESGNNQGFGVFE